MYQNTDPQCKRAKVCPTTVAKVGLVVAILGRGLKAFILVQFTEIDSHFRGSLCSHLCSSF